MSLNMFLGEVRSQSQSMNAMCTATIQGMEQAINSIDAFVFDAVLQGQTYDSAKAYFAQTFRPLAQGIIYLCEELIRQNDAFPNEFQSRVASTDVIEQEILEQIRGIDRTRAGIEVISSTLPGMQAMVHIFDAMKRKLQEKLEHLREFNYTSSSNYDTALQLAASIAQGLAEVQSGKGFSPASGTFSVQELNMEWTGAIQKIAEGKAREAQIEREIALREQEANRPWYQRTATAALEFLQGVPGFSQGFDIAIVENVFGLTPPVSDELENRTSYQAGRLVGNVLSGAWSIVEILGGCALVTGSNVGTVFLEIGTGGLVSPIALPANAAITAAGVGVITHGGYVGYNTIQNSIDNFQKFQYSSGGKSVKQVENMKDFFENGFGNEIKSKVSKTSKKYQGQTVYKVDKKVDNPYLKKGDQFYLDNLHKDHIEVFDKQGNFRAVLNLDGNINIEKTKKAIGRKLK
ncbi:cytosolic protein [Bacillus pseudomycoides]|nr:cytosolic protein [Bacillus pseudomycoides]